MYNMHKEKLIIMVNEIDNKYKTINRRNNQ